MNSRWEFCHDWIIPGLNSKLTLIVCYIFVGMLLPSKRITVRMTSYYKLTSLNFFIKFISVILLFILCIVMWRLSYNSVLFTIWGLKLALCCSLKFPSICFGCVRFQESSERSWNLTFFGHGKSWKVMEFELPKRVWTLGGRSGVAFVGWCRSHFRLLFRDHKCPFHVAVHAKGIMHMFELTFLIFGSGDKLFCSVC